MKPHRIAPQRWNAFGEQVQYQDNNQKTTSNSKVSPQRQIRIRAVPIHFVSFSSEKVHPSTDEPSTLGLPFQLPGSSGKAYSKPPLILSVFSRLLCLFQLPVPLHPTHEQRSLRRLQQAVTCRACPGWAWHKQGLCRCVRGAFVRSGKHVHTAEGLPM